MTDPEPKAEAASPAPARERPRRASRDDSKAITPAGERPPTKLAQPEAPRAPKRATLDPADAAALRLRRATDRRRPRFTRQASYRYERIGRWEAWRRPRGLQSKQRRHYKYRSTVVSIGFRTPARARGLAPSGFRPVIVRTAPEIERLDAARDAAIIARTVGTRRRLALEETARRLGIRVLNPIATPEGEE